MKFSSLVFSLALAAGFSARAQVVVELELDQQQFLPSESLPVAVRITNRSGQPLRLGTDPNWLTFSVTSLDNFVVTRVADVSSNGHQARGSGAVF